MHDDTPKPKERVCDECGYSLKGLEPGVRCPECGAKTRAGGISARDTTMSATAPTWFVKFLRYGFLLCTLAIIGGAGFPIILSLTGYFGSINFTFVLMAIMWVATAGAWTGGVWMVTRPRRGIGEQIRDPVLDSDTYRMVVRFGSIAWPVYVLFSAIAACAPSSAITTSIVYRGVSGLFGITAWVSLIPACVYFANLAYWASDETICNKLRGTAWFMTVCGVLGVVMGAVGRTNAPFAGFANIIAFWMGLITFGATVYLCILVIRLGSALAWVIRHQKAKSGSHERVAARIKQRIERPTAVAGDLYCEECGYNLEGLPFGGNCPECGTSYADNTPLPIRDPMKDRAYRDDSPIDLADESEHDEIVHRKVPEPVRPQVDVPDDGAIPLSDSDDIPDEPEEFDPEQGSDSDDGDTMRS
jgi:predicted Zn-ribbon and HTH transcriptional regulator